MKGEKVSCLSPSRLLKENATDCVAPQRQKFLTVLEAGSLRTGCQHGWVLGKSQFQGADCRLGWVLTFGRGQEAPGLLDKSTPSSSLDYLPLTSSSNAVILGVRFQHRSSGVTPSGHGTFQCSGQEGCFDTRVRSSLQSSGRHVGERRCGG